MKLLVAVENTALGSTTKRKVEFFFRGISNERNISGVIMRALVNYLLGGAYATLVHGVYIPPQVRGRILAHSPFKHLPTAFLLAE